MHPESLMPHLGEEGGQNNHTGRCAQLYLHCGTKVCILSRPTPTAVQVTSFSRIATGMGPYLRFVSHRRRPLRSTGVVM